MTGSPQSIKEYRWIVADPDLVGGKLALRLTRLSVSLMRDCMVNGMTSDDIQAAYGYDLPLDAFSENLHVAPELTESFHVTA